mgnify:CR=1 FL=1
MVKKKSNQIRARIITSDGTKEVDLETKGQPDFIVSLIEKETETGGIIAQMEVLEKPSCGCVKYSGDNFFCRIHPPKVECPKCHCIDSEIEEKSDYPTSVKNYHCRICGEFYLRKMGNGSYQW